MDVGHVLLGLLGLAAVFVFTYLLNRAAKERQDTRRRREMHDKEKRVVSFSEDTGTHLGHS